MTYIEANLPNLNESNINESNVNPFDSFLSKLNTDILIAIQYIFQEFLDFLSSGEKIAFFETVIMKSLNSIKEFLKERVMVYTS